MGLGDLIEKALTKVGVTKERVEAYLGRPCGCTKRRDKLNQLSNWAYRLVFGGQSEEDAKKAIEDKMTEDEKKSASISPPRA